MKSKEWKNQFSLADYARENFYYIETGNGVKINCPFHDDKTPSCFIGDKSYYCFGCGAKGDSINFLQEYLGLSFSDIINSTEFVTEFSGAKTKRRKRRKIPLPTQRVLDNATNRLLVDKSAMEWIYSRHIDLNAVKKFDLGLTNNPPFAAYKSQRLIIPVFDNGKLVNCRYRISPNCHCDEPKYLGHPGMGVSLFNISDTKNKHIVIAGSELDAILLSTHGIPSVGLPGENNFQEDWVNLFVDKDVLIWLDYDWAGVTGAIKIFNMLNHVSSVRIFDWPNNFPSKSDIKDFVDVYGIEKTTYVANRLLKGKD